ncbi:MAG TPA: ADOP family duplicated permease [Vicinamibacterales bacterium]|nr:ADOP family duplicated permease [Vicinamibacterales bacterium]
MRLIDQLHRDLSYSLRTLRRSPVFAASAVLSLALGIGANAALFSVVDALLLRSLPVAHPGELVLMTRPDPSGKLTPLGRGLDALNADTSTFAGATSSVLLPETTITIDGAPEASRTIARVTPTFFHVLGVAPAVGRAEGTGAIAILGDRYWRSRFQASAAVIDRPLVINGETYRVSGVAPAGFLGVSLDSVVDVWIVTPNAPFVARESIVRMQRGVSPAAAQSAAEALFQRLDAAPADSGPRPRVVVAPAGQGSSSLRERYRGPLLALMALVVIVLLITCTNVGHLLVVRNAGRVHELTVRAAIGAGRARLMTQLVVESVVLAIVGGVGAWMVATWGVSMLLSTLPVSSVPEQLQFRTDARMLAFLAGLSFVSAVLFALVPARRATRIDLASALRTTRTMAASRTSRLGHWQVAAQVAFSVVLLTAAMLFVRTVRNVTHFDLGFDSHNLIQVELVRDPPIRAADLRGVEERLFASVSAVPGVESVSAYNAPAFPQYFAGVPHPDGPFGGSVGPDFFKTMRIPLLRGRTFIDDDATRSQAVAIVNEAYEREILNGDAIGKRIQNGPFNVEIVGVVGNASLHNVRWRDAGLYRMGLRDERLMTALEVRTNREAAYMLRPVAAAVSAAVPGWMLSAQTMDDLILKSISRERMVATTSVSFATLGLVLAAFGLFGVAAFAVAERTSELGLRIAIGARPRDVIRASLGGTVRLVGIGLAVGTGAAMALATVLGAEISGLLFGLTPTDWTNVLAAALLMMGAAIVACVVPALRATRIDPLQAIRSE